MECGLDLDDFPPFVWSIEPRRSIPTPPPKDPFDLVAAADTAPAPAAARRLLPFLSRLLAPFFARPRPSFAPEEEDDNDNDDDDNDDDDDDNDDDKEGEGGGCADQFPPIFLELL